jgi:hypothetical protein
VSVAPLTPLVPGSDSITIAGSGFGTDPELVTVSLASDKSACAVTTVVDTEIVCALSSDVVGGDKRVLVDVWPMGRASVATGSFATVSVGLAITGVSPTSGSVRGGTILTISGYGFAPIGPYQRVTVGGVDCVPRVIRNYECKPSGFDRGFSCDRGIGHYQAPISVRQSSHWIDFSSSTSIQCQVASQSNVTEGAATITLQMVSSSRLQNETLLREDLTAADNNFDCWVLAGCAKRNKAFDAIGVFGDDFVFDGATDSFAGYAFADAATPVVTSMSPDSGMVGTEVIFRGSGFAGTDPTDENFYETQFGFFEQTVSLASRRISPLTLSLPHFRPISPSTSVWSSPI